MILVFSKIYKICINIQLLNIICFDMHFKFFINIILIVRYYVLKFHIIPSGVLLPFSISGNRKRTY
jgi:hypothetical protein